MNDKQNSRCILCKRIVLKRRKLFPEIDARRFKPFSSCDKRLREINMSRPEAGWSEPHRRWSPRRRPGATFVSPLASSPRRWLSRWAGAGLYIVLVMQRNTKKQENHLVLLFREKLQLHIGVTARKQLKCFHSWRKCKFAFFSDDDVLTKMAKVEKVCEETFYELSFIKLRPSLLNVIFVEYMYIVNIVTPIITNHYQIIHFTLNKQPLSFIKKY